jgi:hypothetical protein
MHISDMLNFQVLCYCNMFSVLLSDLGDDILFHFPHLLSIPQPPPWLLFPYSEVEDEVAQLLSAKETKVKSAIKSAKSLRLKLRFFMTNDI